MSADGRRREDYRGTRIKAKSPPWSKVGRPGQSLNPHPDVRTDTGRTGRERFLFPSSRRDVET